LGGLRPSKETDESILEDESDAYARVEAPEIGGHGRDRKVRASNIGARAAVLDMRICWIMIVWWRIIGEFLCWEDLREEAGEYQYSCSVILQYTNL
jgi:hypothetical protein